ncbi:MAG: hypothetical protein RSF79_28275, partial [Janthinobacterium sp.]
NHQIGVFHGLGRFLARRVHVSWVPLYRHALAFKIVRSIRYFTWLPPRRRIFRRQRQPCDTNETIGDNLAVT